MDNNENVEKAGEQVQGATMDACLNLDLGMFTVFGKTLGDWTYDDLGEYVCANYAENFGEVMYDSYTGARIRYYDNGMDLDKTSISIIEDYSIQIRSEEGDSYTMLKTEWSRSLWTLSSYNPLSESVVAAICGQSVDSYLDSICPGLYEKLQEEPTIYLKDGVAMMDSLSNGTQRISLCVLGGNLELGCQDEIIESLTVIFTE